MKREVINIAFILMFLVAATLIACKVQVAQANPGTLNLPHSVFRDVPPPEGAQVPIVSIQTPQNGSTYKKNVTLTYEVSFPTTNVGLFKLYYKGNWNPEIIVIPKDKFGAFPNNSYSIDLSNVRGGNISITVYAVGVGLIMTGQEAVDSSHRYTYYDRFEIVGYSTVSFIKDLVPPRISILSPQNITYTVPEAKLDFTVNEAVSQILYNLDNVGNQSTSGNITLTGLLNGVHNVTLYAADLVGNPATPKTLFFNVNAPESFPVMSAIAISVVVLGVSAGLMFHFKKGNR